MQPRRPVTERDVINAAKNIAAQGEMPTIAAVRRAVGNRGSETTILKYLNQWKLDLLKYATSVESTSKAHEALVQEKVQNIRLRDKIAAMKSELQRMMVDDL